MNLFDRLICRKRQFGRIVTIEPCLMWSVHINHYCVVFYYLYELRLRWDHQLRSSTLKSNSECHETTLKTHRIHFFGVWSVWGASSQKLLTLWRWRLFGVFSTSDHGLIHGFPFHNINTRIFPTTAGLCKQSYAWPWYAVCQFRWLHSYTQSPTNSGYATISQWETFTYINSIFTIICYTNIIPHRPNRWLSC